MQDLTGNTVTPETLQRNETATDKSGAPIVGTAEMGGVDAEPIIITENGTYSAPEGSAYDPVTVNVPQTTVETLAVTENGTYNAPSGKAYDPVTVNVPQTTVEPLAVTENGEYTPPAGTAYGPVTVSVGSVTKETLTVTENGTYNAPSGKAYDPVTVNVPQTTVESLQITENGTYTAPAGKAYSPITVNVPSSGGETPEAEIKDVNFYDDWANKRVYSYTAAEFLALNAMPENPSHRGAVAKGWNWSLADAKAYVTNYGGLDIGQMYDIDDEDGAKARIYVTVQAGDALNLLISGSTTVDWGDGSARESFSYSAFHDYSAAGNYCIKILTACNLSGAYIANQDVNFTGGWTTTPGSPAGNSVTRVELGSGMGLSSSTAMQGLGMMETMILPYDLSTTSAVGHCQRLRGLTIPSSITSWGSDGYSYNSSMQYFSCGKNLASSDSSSRFDYCGALQRLTLPEGVTTLPGCRQSYSLNTVIGKATTRTPPTYTFDHTALEDMPDIGLLDTLPNSCFSQCGALRKIKITGEDKSVGTYAFQYCRSASEIELDALVTATGASIFRYCLNVQKITATANGGFVTTNTSHNYQFANCTALTEVDFSLATSVNLTGQYAFSSDTALQKITFGASTTQIGSYTFSGCTALTLIDFRLATSIPALANGTNTTIPYNNSGLQIVVPDALYDSWIATTNWSNSRIKAKIVKASDYEGGR